MTASDIDNALRVLNIEPLYGHTPYNPATFRRALPFAQSTSAGPVYFVEDEEIDFDRVLREEKITLPKGVSWTAHWLAVEGVQPLIEQNPPAIPREAPLDPSAVAPDGTLASVIKTEPGVPQMNGVSLPNAASANSKLTQQQKHIPYADHSVERHAVAEQREVPLRAKRRGCNAQLAKSFADRWVEPVLRYASSPGSAATQHKR